MHKQTRIFFAPLMQSRSGAKAINPTFFYYDMPARRRHLKVFLCHASGDKPQVLELYKRLTKNGIDAWLDQEKLLPGQDWREEIPKAVREADVVVICLSNKSITKEGYVQKEIRFALDVAEEKPPGSIFIIPARLEDCEIPEPLSKWHWVDLFSEQGYEKLIRSLQARARNINVSPVRIRPDLRPAGNKTSSSIQSEIKRTETSVEPERIRENKSAGFAATDRESTSVIDDRTSAEDDTPSILVPQDRKAKKTFAAPTARSRPETVYPNEELDIPAVSFLIKFVFTLVILLLFIYLTYSYFTNKNPFTCTPPAVSAAGVSITITLWLLVGLGRFLQKERAINLISRVPPHQPKIKALITKPKDLLLPGEGFAKLLLALGAIVALSIAIIWGLNWKGIPIFYVSEETPQVSEFAINYSDRLQKVRPGETIQVERGQQFLITATDQPTNVTCSWFSAERGNLVLESNCSTQYGPPVVKGTIDTLSVQIQSACKTKSVFVGLNIKILDS